MPFRSKSQQKWIFAHRPQMAKKWANETPSFGSLPEHAPKQPAIHTSAPVNFDKLTSFLDENKPKKVKL